MSRKKTNSEYISQLKDKFGDFFDYSEVNYINSKTKVKLICPKHGDIIRIPNKHLISSGCPNCYKEEREIDTSKLIKSFIDIHGYKYDYKLVEYTGKENKVSIICPYHGKFNQLPLHHRKGQGCMECSIEDKKCKSNDLEVEFDHIHDNKYDYSEMKYKGWDIPIKIKCKKHGFFHQIPNNHKRGHGCPSCSLSKGELEVKGILDDMEIEYIEQHKMDKCIHKKSLIFDFYLPKLNTVIEFNGVQHYQPVDIFGGVDNFKLIKKRDNIKEEFCLSNNIDFLVIKYDEDCKKKIINLING